MAKNNLSSDDCTSPLFNNFHHGVGQDGIQLAVGSSGRVVNPNVTSAGDLLAQQLILQHNNAESLSNQNVENPSSTLNQIMQPGSSSMSMLLAQHREQEKLQLVMNILQGGNIVNPQTNESNQHFSSTMAALLNNGGTQNGQQNSEISDHFLPRANQGSNQQDSTSKSFPKSGDTNALSSAGRSLNQNSLLSNTFFNSTSNLIPSSNYPNSNALPSVHNSTLKGILRDNVAHTETITIKKKKKKKKKEKERDRPPRPLSAYNLFFKDERKKILASFSKRSDGIKNEDKSSIDGSDATDSSDADRQNDESQSKGIGFENLAKTIGRRWKKILPERLEHYKALAKKDQERYAVEMKVHEEKLRALWFKEQEDNEKKQQKEAAEKAEADLVARKASDKTNEVPVQNNDASFAQKNGFEEKEVHIKKRKSDDRLSVPPTHNDSDANSESSYPKKVKSYHADSPSQVDSTTVASNNTSSSPVNSEIRPNIMSMLLGNPNQGQINDSPLEIGMDSIDMDTMVVIKQVDEQIKKLLNLRNQLVQNSNQKHRLLQGQLQQQQQNQGPAESSLSNGDSIIQNMVQQQMVQDLFMQSRSHMGMNNRIGTNGSLQSHNQSEQVQTQTFMNNNARNPVFNTLNTETSNSELEQRLLDNVRNAQFAQAVQDSSMNNNSVASRANLDQLLSVQQARENILRKSDDLNGRSS